MPHVTVFETSMWTFWEALSNPCITLGPVAVFSLSLICDTCRLSLQSAFALCLRSCLEAFMKILHDQFVPTSTLSVAHILCRPSLQSAFVLCPRNSPVSSLRTRTALSRTGTCSSVWHVVCGEASSLAWSRSTTPPTATSLSR